MYVNFKDKGIEYAKQAVTEDEAGNAEKALQLYMSSLEYFKTYLKYEKNPKAQEAIKGKVRGGVVVGLGGRGACLRWKRWGGLGLGWMDVALWWPSGGVCRLGVRGVVWCEERACCPEVRRPVV